MARGHGRAAHLPRERCLRPTPAASSTGLSRSTRGTVLATTRCCTSPRGRLDRLRLCRPGATATCHAVARTNVLLAVHARARMQAVLRERPEWWRFIAIARASSTATSRSPLTPIRCSRTTTVAALARCCASRDCSFPRRSRPERRSVPITQDELATLVNVSRTTLLQILRRFEERGLIEQAYRALRVVDAAGLKEIAEGRQR
jgi:hypothetical protein